MSRNRNEKHQTCVGRHQSQNKTTHKREVSCGVASKGRRTTKPPFEMGRVSGHDLPESPARWRCGQSLQQTKPVSKINAGGKLLGCVLEIVAAAIPTVGASFKFGENSLINIKFGKTCSEFGHLTA